MNRIRGGADFILRMSAEREPLTTGTDRMSRIERLLEHREWLRDLSRRLVVDANLADDLVQKTWLAAVERPPHHTQRPRAWLATVMRNWLRREWRDEAVKRRHEQAAARPESIAGPDELVVRAEEMRVVVGAVLALDDPYRTTLLYRHHEGLAPRHIAERMGIPVETVRTRLKRGMAMVRRDLDAHHGGDGRTWALALLPLTTMPVSPASVGAQASAAARGGDATGYALGELLVKATLNKAAVVTVLLVLALFGGGAALLAAQEGGSGDVAAEGDQREADTGPRRTRVGEEASATDDGDDGPARAGVGDGEPAASSAAGHALGVTVLDVDGAPLGGARVEWYRQPSIFPLFGAWEKGRRLLRGVAPVAAAVTGDDGIATATLPGDGPWTMITRAAGHATGFRWSVNSPLGADRSAPLVERLLTGYAIDGCILSRDGSPAAGIELLADSIGMSGTVIRGSRTVTAADGTFRLDGLRPGEAHLFAGGVRLARLRVPTTSPVTLTLGGNVIRGRVTRAEGGAPIGGVAVFAQLIRETLGVVRTTTDADGRYELDTLVPAFVSEIRLEREGLVDTRTTMSIDGGVGFDALGHGRMDFTMSESASLTGIVRTDGVPIADVGVAVVLRDWRSFATRTDANGRYVLTTVPPGSVVVIVDAQRTTFYQAELPANWLDAHRRGKDIKGWSVSLTAGVTTEHDLSLTNGVTVRGTVRHPDGSPAEGARVTFGSGTTPVSDAAGHFVSRGVRPAAGATVFASLPGARAFQQVNLLDESARTGLDIVMQPATRIVGRVTNRRGESVRGAFVQIFASRRRLAERASVSDDGSFELLTLERGTVSLRAFAPGHSPAEPLKLDATPGAELGNVRFLLDAAVSISGTARTSRGVPIEGARVALIEGGTRTRNTEDRDLLTAAVTNAKGRFVIPDVAQGSWTLVLVGDEIVRWERALDVAAPMTIDVTCTRARTISGVIQHPGTAPLTGVSVIAYRQGARTGEPGYRVSVNCAADGTFVLTGLRDGVYDIKTFVWKRVKKSLLNVEMKGIAAGAEDLVIDMRPAGEIHGVVVDPDGRGIAHARVQAFSESGHRGTPSGATDADGSFQITGIDPAHGPYTLRIKPPEPQRLPRFEVLGPYTTATIEGVQVGQSGIRVVIPIGNVIEGVIVDSAGKPQPGVWVKAECVTHDKLSPHERTWLRGPGTQAGEDGHFRFQGLPDAAFALFLMPNPYSDPNGQPRALAGAEHVTAGTTGLTLRTAAVGSVTGVVVDDDGTPVANTRVTAMPEGTEILSARVTAKTDSNGHFTLAALVVGRAYAATVSVPDRVRTTVLDVRAGGGLLRIELSRGESISGRLIVPEGQSAKRRFLRLYHSDGDYETGLSTNDNGAFERNALLPGTYRVEVQTNPGEWPAAMQSVGTITTGTNDIVIRLE